MGSENEIQERLSAAKELVGTFLPERIVFLTCQVLSFIFLIWCAIQLLKNGQVEQAFGMFTATGVMSVTTGGFLWMFNQALKFVGQSGGKK